LQANKNRTPQPFAGHIPVPGPSGSFAASNRSRRFDRLQAGSYKVVPLSQSGFFEGKWSPPTKQQTTGNEINNPIEKKAQAILPAPKKDRSLTYVGSDHSQDGADQKEEAVKPVALVLEDGISQLEGSPSTGVQPYSMTLH